MMIIQVQNETVTKCLSRPSFGEVFFSVISMATKHMPRPLCLFPRIENETKCLLARFLQPYFTD